MLRTQKSPKPFELTYHKPRPNISRTISILSKYICIAHIVGKTRRI